ncbi:MAG: hypothetical protein JOZ41_05705 [Chloroflexi bacterium]|nr:hypothetical protein [Chloroflexota bacterium]
MTPFAFWLSWSALWLEAAARWWALVLPPLEQASDDLTDEERRHLEMLRQRFAAEIAQRRGVAPEDPSWGTLTA